MISSLHGTVLHVGVDALVVEVAGVGFSVAVTPQVARGTHVGGDIRLHTSLIVREDALSLFGFADRDEIEVFGLLIGVTGVGPKSALGVLSTLTVSQVADAVARDDDAPFRRVSGIGPKTAKLIVLQLAGKLDTTRVSSATANGSTAPIAGQVVQALIGLGWSERLAAETVTAVAAEASPSDRSAVATLLRLTLAQLGPARKEPAGG